MNKFSVGEILITICVSYTIISITAAVINILAGTETNNFNTIAMLLYTGIAVFVLSLHRLFKEVSPLFMIIIQYVVAMGLVLLCTFIIGRFSPVAEGGYKDIFVSFTIPYVIGAVVYYIGLFQEAKQQDDLLQEIKKIQENKEEII